MEFWEQGKVRFLTTEIKIYFFLRALLENVFDYSAIYLIFLTKGFFFFNSQ